MLGTVKRMNRKDNGETPMQKRNNDRLLSVEQHHRLQITCCKTRAAMLRGIKQKPRAQLESK